MDQISPKKTHKTNINQLNKEQKHSQLNPVIYADGIIRLNGRYKNSDLPDETKLPILLCRTKHFTQLLIANIHERNCHAGVYIYSHNFERNIGYHKDEQQSDR